MNTDQRDIYESLTTNRYYRSDCLAHNMHLLECVPSRARVLNAGCGYGESLVGRPRWFGVDFNRNLEPIWRKLNIFRRCWVADCVDLPFPSNGFKWAVSMNFLEHVPVDDLPHVVAELARVAPYQCHIVHTTTETAHRDKYGNSLHPSGGLSISDWLGFFPDGTWIDEPGDNLLRIELCP